MWGILVMIWSIVQMPYMPDFTKFPPVIMNLNIAAIIGAVMLVTGVLFIARDSGLELVELPTIISHVLSYCTYCRCGTFFRGNRHGGELHLDWDAHRTAAGEHYDYQECSLLFWVLPSL